MGFAASLAHPGGNITGASFLALDLDSKTIADFQKRRYRTRIWPYFQNPNQKYFLDRNLYNTTTTGREVESNRAL